MFWYGFETESEYRYRKCLNARRRGFGKLLIGRVFIFIIACSYTHLFENLNTYNNIYDEWRTNLRRASDASERNNGRTAANNINHISNYICQLYTLLSYIALDTTGRNIILYYYYCYHYYYYCTCRAKIVILLILL